MAIAIKEYDGLERELEGSQPIGKHLSLPHCSNDGWTQARTAKDLGVSQQTIDRDIQIATAIEKHPEIVGKTNGQAIPVEHQRIVYCTHESLRTIGARIGCAMP